jgi:hypothetical protein
MINIKQTTTTPEVNLNKEKCILTLEGRSYPENAHRFYKPILKEFINCKEDIKKSNIIIDIKLEVINSVSMRYIYEMIDFIGNNTKSTIVNWYYEFDDEDMRESIEVASSAFAKVNINDISVTEF